MPDKQQPWFVDFQDVWLAYNDELRAKNQFAVEAIHLQVRQGEFIAIVGPSGCGKSTFMKLATGLKMPSMGKILIDGWMVFASKDSEFRNTLRGVDLMAMQPYLLKATDTGVRSGTLDLDMQSTVKANHLHAPGTLTLNGLQLDSGGTFMGAPSAAVLKLMKDKDGKITMKFVLDGKLNDPNFRLNEGFSTRLASSFGEAMGISVEGLAKGAGSLGQKSVEAAGGSAEGVGKAVKGLFGR